MAVKENSRITINYYKIQDICQVEQTASKQVVTTTYTLEKMFFAVDSSEGLRVVSFLIE